MFSIDKFKLIEPYESIELYNCQEKLIQKYNQTRNSHIILSIAILQTLYPIEDYFTAMDILDEFLKFNNNFEMCIVGAYLYSTWCNFNKNKYLCKMKSFKKEYTNQEKAIIYYLEAYHIYMNNDQQKKNRTYQKIVRYSILFRKKYVNNYLLLAKSVDTVKRKELIKIAQKNIEVVYTDEIYSENDITRKISYEWFLKEEVQGTVISEDRYKLIFMNE